MLDFYKRCLLAFLALILITVFWGSFCFDKFQLQHKLLPATESVIPWRLRPLTDQMTGGSSSITVLEANQYLDYSYILTDKLTYPSVTAVISFGDSVDSGQLVDLSKYSKLVFNLKCVPDNVLSIHLHSFDTAVTQPDNLSSYRISEALSACDPEWSIVTVDLQHMYVPTWWLDWFALENSDQSYQLNKVKALSFNVSRQGPINTPAKVSLNNLYLVGSDWRYAWLFLLSTLLIWLAGILWLLRVYTRHLKIQLGKTLIKSRPLIAHKQLTLEPGREDVQLTAILSYMATEYSDPDMSLEKATAALKINRTRLNEILRQELGLTFTAYLNKLRLLEAARMLKENKHANVAEIAYKVGYNNVTYFNRLFKSEFGCSPKMFKKIYRNREGD